MVVATLELEPSWLDPCIAFLSDRSLLSNIKEAEKVHGTWARFWLSKDRRLYQHFFGGPYLLCLHSSKIVELLAELHEGICDGHVGGKSLEHQAMTQGFWLSNMQRETVDYV